jgi:hypothetical protein
MRTYELKAWLRGSHEPISTTEIGAFLGVEPYAIPHTSMHSLRFVIAALRDTYVDDLDVWLWFVRPRGDLGGARPADLLLAGRMAELEAAAVRQWNLFPTGDERAGILPGAPTLAETSVPASFEGARRNAEVRPVVARWRRITSTVEGKSSGAER